MKEFNFYGDTWFWRTLVKFDYCMTIDETEVQVTEIRQGMLKKSKVHAFDLKDVQQAVVKRKIVRPVWFWFRIVLGVLLTVTGILPGLLIAAYGIIDDYRRAIIVKLNDGKKIVMYCNAKTDAEMSCAGGLEVLSWDVACVSDGTF